MSDFAKHTKNELAHLNRIVSSHIRQLNVSLRKINVRHFAQSKPLGLPKPGSAFPANKLFSGLASGFGASVTGVKSSPVNVSRASGGQVLSDIASAISKAIKRDL